MQNNKLVEILFFPKYAQGNLSHKELMRWLDITLQTAIRQQDELTKKLFLKTLKDMPAIYLS